MLTKNPALQTQNSTQNSLTQNRLGWLNIRFILLGDGSENLDEAGGAGGGGKIFIKYVYEKWNAIKHVCTL